MNVLVKLWNLLGCGQIHFNAKGASIDLEYQWTTQAVQLAPNAQKTAIEQSFLKYFGPTLVLNKKKKTKKQQQQQQQRRHN